MLLRTTGGVLVLLAFTWGCGSRTKLRLGHEQSLIACVGREDCDQSNRCAPQLCVDGYCAYDTPVTCGAPPACSSVACNPDTGACETTPLTEDWDGDGFLGPLPGFRAGTPQSCGDDCDDTNAQARPGGREICDGVDNDCDGAIDNGISYLDVDALDGLRPVPIGKEFQSSSLHGGAYGDDRYFVSYWAEDERALAYVQGLNRNGEATFTPTLLTQARGNTFSARVAFSGQFFGTLWATTQLGGNYEIYFGLFDSAGNKLIPDVRLTASQELSIRERLLFDQGRFVATWDESTQGHFDVQGRLISAEGEPLGENVPLSEPEEEAQNAYLAATESRFGIVYMDVRPGEGGFSQTLRFRSFAKDFSDGTPSLALAEGAENVRVTPVSEVFLVTWDEAFVPDGTGAAVWGVVLSDRGDVLVAPTQLTQVENGSRCRSSNLVSLGDRALLVFSANYSGKFELYAQVVDASFQVVEPMVRLTEDGTDPLTEEVVLSDRGEVAVLYNAATPTGKGGHFLSLGCGSFDQEEPPIR